MPHFLDWWQFFLSFFAKTILSAVMFLLVPYSKMCECAQGSFSDFVINVIPLFLCQLIISSCVTGLWFWVVYAAKSAPGTQVVLRASDVEVDLPVERLWQAVATLTALVLFLGRETRIW